MKKAFFLVLYFSIFFSKGNTNLDSVSISVFFDKLNQLPEKKDSLFKEIFHKTKLKSNERKISH
jgi:hypothetical protein